MISTYENQIWASDPTQSLTSPPMMTNPETSPLDSQSKNKSSHCKSIVEREAIPFSIQQAFGESFIGPYAVFLGAPKPLVAILSTVPLLFGALLQPLALVIMSRFRDRSFVLFLLTFFQALIWVPIIGIGYAGWSGENAGYALVASVILFYVIGMLGGPIWNSLVGDILEPSLRIDAFSRRNLYAGISMLVGFLVVGGILRWSAAKDLLLWGFTLTFVVAAVSRVVSSIMLKKHPSPPFTALDSDYFSFRQFLERSYESNFLKFVIYVAVTNLAINISAPFITVYLLRDLSLSYTDYSFAIASGFVTQLFVTRRWGSILEEVGSRRVLMISSIGFALTPFLWLFSGHLWWLCFVSGLRGMLAIGYQISVSTFIFDAVTPGKRARCAAYQSIVNNFSIVLGALFGGWIVSVVPRVDGLHTDSNILLLFALSGALNVITLAFLTSFKEVREVRHRPATSILFHLASLRSLGEVLVRVGGSEKSLNNELSSRDVDV